MWQTQQQQPSLGLAPARRRDGALNERDDRQEPSAGSSAGGAERMARLHSAELAAIGGAPPARRGGWGGRGDKQPDDLREGDRGEPGLRRIVRAPPGAAIEIGRAHV